MNEYQFQRLMDKLQDQYDNEDPPEWDDEDDEEEDEGYDEPDYEAILENRREWAAASYDRIYGGW